MTHPINKMLIEVHMKKLVALGFVLLFCLCQRGYSQDMVAIPKVYNLSSFTSTNIFQYSHELDSLTPSQFKLHPEYGKLPFNTQCSDCEELIDKRTISGRYFIKRGSKGQTFYVQQCYGQLHYP